MSTRYTDHENLDDKQLEKMAAGLRSDIAPQRDLWPDIESAIRAPAKTSRSRWTPLFAQAAAVVLLVGASSGVTYMAMNDQQSTGPEVVNTEMLFAEASFANRYELGADFQSARDALVEELDTELQKLSPESRLTIESNLEVIHLSVLSMNAALEQDPDNTLLQERILRSYRDELALLRRVSGLTRNVMLRNDI